MRTRACALARRSLRALSANLCPRIALIMSARAAQPEAPLECGECTAGAACVEAVRESMRHGRGEDGGISARVQFRCFRMCGARSTRVRALVQCAEHEKTPVEHQVGVLVQCVAGMALCLRAVCAYLRRSSSVYRVA